MCLVVALWGLDAEVPLLVGANRDERLERPAIALAVLRGADPRVLGGRDLRAGGTWMAVSESGVVVALTNWPLLAGPDPAKRSRGEIPLQLASQRSADDAVELLSRTVVPSDYNPARLLVGDRLALYSVELPPAGPLVVEALGPGTHVLENRPLRPPSAKAAHVARLVEAGVLPLATGERPRALQAVLADHGEPPGGADTSEMAGRPLSYESACVHTPDYGTRWSGVVSVPATGASPTFLVADGPPCRTPFVDVSARFGDGSDVLS